MKKIALLGILFTIRALSIEMNLSSGESAVIRANVDTQVFCNGNISRSPSGLPGCGTIVQSFNKIISACMTSDTGGHCVDKYWPDFKTRNFNCVPRGIQSCLDACMKSYSGGYCAERCQ